MISSWAVDPPHRQVKTDSLEEKKCEKMNQILINLLKEQKKQVVDLKAFVGERNEEHQF